MVIDRIQYKSRTSFSDNLRTHVWIVDVDDPTTRQLTNGPFYDHALSFSPRGDEIAFVSNHELDPDAVNNSDIFAVDLRGQVRQLTNTKGCEYEPTWSPDGKWIAYTATKREGTTIDSVAEDTHVWITDAAGNAGRDLTAELDRRARSPRWEPDGRSILVLANDRGRTVLEQVGLAGKELRAAVLDRDAPNDIIPLATNLRLEFPFQITGFSIGKTAGLSRSVVAYTMSRATRPATLSLIFTVGPGPTRRLTQPKHTPLPSSPQPKH